MRVPLCVKAVIESPREPDWQAAHRAIDEITAGEVEVLVNDGAMSVYPISNPQSFHEHVHNHELAQEAKPILREHLEYFRALVEEDEIDPDLYALHLRCAQIYCAGGLSWGEPPSPIYAAMSRLEACGILAAAGFDT